VLACVAAWCLPLAADLSLVVRTVSKHLYHDELRDFVKIATDRFLQPVIEAVQGIQQIVERIQVRRDAVLFIRAEQAPGRCFSRVPVKLYFQTTLSHPNFYPLH